MSNFDFLKDFDETLYKLGNRIEREVTIAPSAVKADATPFLEYIVNKLLNRVGLKFNYRKDFYSQLDMVYRKGIIDYNYKDKIYSAYMLRNRIHDNYEEMVKNEQVVALSLHEKLFNIAKKYYHDFNENANDFTGVPSYLPIELDSSDDEAELVQIPDFSEIIDFRYDYCVICGEPNHSSYSLCCPKCSRVLDDANNYISIRNHFGKDATFTRESLIEYGMHEGYINQLITHLARENLIKVSGRFYTFNNMYFDSYMKKIDDYLAVGELITKFREDKITPAEIKRTREYREGSLKHVPFYEFYKIIDHEVIDKFERDILSTENIWDSIEYTTITQRQLETWYMKNLGHYRRGNVNESFVEFNNLLMADYIDLKRQGMSENDIKSQLNVSPKVYDFWLETDDSFESQINQIKRDLLLNALKEGKTKAEAIEIAGVTPHEYDNIYKLSSYRNDDYASEISREMEARKSSFTCYLESMSLERACSFARITVDDFHIWYDETKTNSPFYLESTRILMQKYLDERKKGKSKSQSLKNVELKEKYLNQWLNRSLDICREFKDEDLRVTVGLVLRGFKWDKSRDEIAVLADVDVATINRFLRLGEKGSRIHKPLFDYYENEVIPRKLDMFLQTRDYNSFRKSLELADLTEEEFSKYENLGKSGDERFTKFYEDLYMFKRGIYLHYLVEGKSKKIALRESRLSDEEYDEHAEDLEESIETIRRIIVMEEINDNRTTTFAANKANVSVDEIYEWYFRGRDGEEKYKKFYKVLHGGYVRPAINAIQESLDNNTSHLDFLIKTNKDRFTKKDVEIWVDNGLLDNRILALNLMDKDEYEKSKSNFNSNEMLKEMGVEDYDRISRRKVTNSSSILSSTEIDVEKLKKEILRK